MMAISHISVQLKQHLCQWIHMFRSCCIDHLQMGSWRPCGSQQRSDRAAAKNSSPPQSPANASHYIADFNKTSLETIISIHDPEPS